MNHRQVVRITKGTNKVRGTGYLVAPKRVLTAQHVVASTSTGGRGRLRVAPADDPSASVEASIAWSDEESDIAVLELSQDLAIDVVSPDLRDTSPHGPIDWESRGFPMLDERTAHPESIAFSGSAIETSRGAIDLHVALDPRSGSGWRGISGAPIFNQNTGELIGVVSSVQPRTSRFHANSIRCIARLPEFLEAAQLKPSYERRSRDLVTNLLRQNPKVLSALHEVFGFAVQPKSAELVSSRLLESKAETALRVLRTSLHQLEQNERNVVRRLVATVLPTFAEFDEPIRELREAFSARTAVIDSGAATEAFAEVLLAANDSRPCSFVFRPTHGLIGTSAISVNEPMRELGIDINSDQFVDSVVRFLSDALFVQSHPGAVEGALRSIVSLDDPELPPYYLLVQEESLKSDPQVAQGIKRLSGVLPSLRILSLGQDSERLEEQTRQLYAVSLMYRDELQRD